MPPISILIKPASGSCNMRCKYCFYADEQDNREVASYGMMSIDTMRAMVDKALTYGGRVVSFAFQGGEPTLRGLDFFREFVSYVQNHPDLGHIRVNYALQTNGYLIDEEWCEFFARHRFLIGISLDGTKEIHDRYRVDAAGRGTYNRVMDAIALMKKYHVEYNILTVVTASTARSAQKIYRYFQKNGMDYQQYIECLDPIGAEPGGEEYSLTPKRYGDFLKNLFDAWYQDRRKGKQVYNRYFENLLCMLDGQPPESCSMRGVCAPQWVIEADGSTYPCDFYVLDEWRLGNINTDTFEEMEKNRQEKGFVDVSRTVPEECKACRWYPLCRNGCRRNRMEETGKNYFCEAYREFFDYAYPRLAEIYRRVKTGDFT